MMVLLKYTSEREPLAKRKTLQFDRKRYRYAKGPIPEGAVIAAGDDWGSVFAFVPCTILSVMLH